MTKEEIDILWHKAMRLSIEDGDQFTRYRFAELVAAAERNRIWTQDQWTEYERSIAAAERNRTWMQDYWTEYERSIAAAEREACAMEAWELVLGLTDQDTADIVLRAIRARGEK